MKCLGAAMSRSKAHISNPDNSEASTLNLLALLRLVRTSVWKSKHAESSSEEDSSVTESSKPDVVLMVWCEVFHEYSHVLGTWSEGIHEMRNKHVRITVLDRNPTEWELIKKLTCPFAKEKITMENLDIALFWFQEFRSISLGLEECDRVLSAEMSEILPEDQTYKDDQSCMDTEQLEATEERLVMLLNSLGKSIRYGLLGSQGLAIGSIRRASSDAPYLFQMDQLASLTSLFRTASRLLGRTLGIHGSVFTFSGG